MSNLSRALPDSTSTTEGREPGIELREEDGQFPHLPAAGCHGEVKCW